MYLVYHVQLKLYETNTECASRKLPGAQESRRMMWFATQAFRVSYGTPIFRISSQDESRNLLMIRLSRTGRNDLVMKQVHTAILSFLYF